MNVVQVERQFRALEVKEKELRRKERRGMSGRGIITRFIEAPELSPRSNAGIIADILHDMHVERKTRVGNVSAAHGPTRPRSANVRGPGGAAAGFPRAAPRPASALPPRAPPHRAVPTVVEALGEGAAQNFLKAFTYQPRKAGAQTFAPAPRRVSKAEAAELSAEDAVDERGDGVELPRYAKSLGVWEDH